MKKSGLKVWFYENDFVCFVKKRVWKPTCTWTQNREKHYFGLILTQMVDLQLRYMTNVITLTLQWSAFLFYVVIYHFHLLMVYFIQLIWYARARRVWPVSRGCLYSSIAPDPTFAFVRGPCCPMLDFVFAFWIMITFNTFVNFVIWYILLSTWFHL
jgi:hypothetical protein